MKHSTARSACSPRPFTTLVLCASLLFVLSAATAKFARLWEPVPIARLIQNVGRYVTKNPKDARGHYTLGRIHSLAFAGATGEIEVIAKHSQTGAALPLPGFPRYESVQTAIPSTLRNLDQPTKVHLVECLLHYRRAVELSPKEALYNLGLGWMLEQGARFAQQVGPPPGNKLGKPTPENWKAEALALYRRAYKLTREADLAGNGNMANAGDADISVEAGEGILRLSDVGAQTITLSERDAIRDHIKKVNDRPRVVTPIIFPLRPDTPLSALLATRGRAMFDLDASGRKRSWPWVNADAGILVWDPALKGRISSGSQLFGLNALDDNGDGQLTGRELLGISVWRDRNVNGRSERGEVTPACRLGIEAITARPTGQTDGVPFAVNGLRIRGRATPTYDWTPTSR
jgi:hypothetical protein